MGPIIAKFVLSKHKMHASAKETDPPFTAEALQESVKKEMGFMKDLFDQSEPFTSREAVVEQVVSQMIVRDYKYLVENSGRERAPKEKYTPLSDPWLSHICYYALQGNTTTVPEYDMLFCEIADVIRKVRAGQWGKKVDNMKTNKFKKMLQEVIDVYNAHHSNTSVI